MSRKLVNQKIGLYLPNKILPKISKYQLLQKCMRPLRFMRPLCPFIQMNKLLPETSIKCYALRDLVPFVQFKKRENTQNIAGENLSILIYS